VGGAAAVAVASVPSGNGVINACLEVTASKSGTVPVSTGPNLRVIDTDAGQSCHTTVAVGSVQALEEPISWNQSGPQGPAGPTGATGPAGATGPPGASGPQGASGADAVAAVLVTPPVTSTTPIGTATIPLPSGGGKTEKVVFQIGGWSIQPAPTTFDKTTTTTANTGKGKGSMLIPIAGESQDGPRRIEILLAQAAGSGAVIPQVTLSVRDASTGMSVGKRIHKPLVIRLTQVQVGVVAYDSKTTKGKGQPPVKETLTLSYNSITVR